MRVISVPTVLGTVEVSKSESKSEQSLDKHHREVDSHHRLIKWWWCILFRKHTIGGVPFWGEADAEKASCEGVIIPFNTHASSQKTVTVGAIQISGRFSCRLDTYGADRHHSLI